MRVLFELATTVCRRWYNGGIVRHSIRVWQLVVAPDLGMAGSEEGVAAFGADLERAQQAAGTAKRESEEEVKRLRGKIVYLPRGRTDGKK